MAVPVPASERLAALEGLGFTREARAEVTTQVERVDRRTEKVISARAAMGTLVQVTALSRSADRAREATMRAFEEMDRLIAIFTRFEAGSPVSHLNGTGSLDGPPELGSVVRAALECHRTTAGAFDVSVAPLLDLFRSALDRPQPREPAAAEIAEARALVGVDGIEVRGNRVGFRREGMSVTLDGIAKGYIVDAVSEVLRRYGIKRFVINAGGDIRVGGRKEGRRPWRVAVRDPERDESFLDTIDITSGAVATSGSYEIFFDRERRFHHIVDATTGLSPNVCTGVSVVAPTAMAADALATAVFVMGPSSGAALIEQLRGCECLIVTRDGRQVRTRGWRSAGSISASNGEA